MRHASAHGEQILSTKTYCGLQSHLFSKTKPAFTIQSEHSVKLLHDCHASAHARQAIPYWKNPESQTHMPASSDALSYQSVHRFKSSISQLLHSSL